MKSLLRTAIALTAGLLTGCSHSDSERDGRQYYSQGSPLQGKMGVTFKRVRTDAPVAAAGEGGAPSTPGSSNESQGLLDRYIKPAAPDEPGAKYWMHGQLAADPIQSKMGVRVQRRKK